MNRLVARALSKRLSVYVKNLSSDRLQVKCFRGEGELRNLELEERVFQEIFSVPPTLEVKEVACSRVVFKIPWKRLRHEPVLVFIDRVSVVLVEPEVVLPVAEFRTLARKRRTKRTFIDEIFDGVRVEIHKIDVCIHTLGPGRKLPDSPDDPEKLPPMLKLSLADAKIFRTNSTWEVIDLAQLARQAKGKTEFTVHKQLTVDAFSLFLVEGNTETSGSATQIVGEVPAKMQLTLFHRGPTTTRRVFEWNMEHVEMFLFSKHWRMILDTRDAFSTCLERPVPCASNDNPSPNATLTRLDETNARRGSVPSETSPQRQWKMPRFWSRRKGSITKNDASVPKVDGCDDEADIVPVVDTLGIDEVDAVSTTSESIFDVKDLEDDEIDVPLAEVERANPTTYKLRVDTYALSLIATAGGFEFTGRTLLMVYFPLGLGSGMAPSVRPEGFKESAAYCCITEIYLRDTDGNHLWSPSTHPSIREDRDDYLSLDMRQSSRGAFVEDEYFKQDSPEMLKVKFTSRRPIANGIGERTNTLEGQMNPMDIVADGEKWNRLRTFVFPERLRPFASAAQLAARRFIHIEASNCTVVIPSELLSPNASITQRLHARFEMLSLSNEMDEVTPLPFDDGLFVLPQVVFPARPGDWLGGKCAAEPRTYTRKFQMNIRGCWFELLGGGPLPKPLNDPTCVQLHINKQNAEDPLVEVFLYLTDLRVPLQQMHYEYFFRLSKAFDAALQQAGSAELLEHLRVEMRQRLVGTDPIRGFVVQTFVERGFVSLADTHADSVDSADLVEVTFSELEVALEAVEATRRVGKARTKLCEVLLYPRLLGIPVSHLFKPLPLEAAESVSETVEDPHCLLVRWERSPRENSNLTTWNHMFWLRLAHGEMFVVQDVMLRLRRRLEEAQGTRGPATKRLPPLPATEEEVSLRGELGLHDCEITLLRSIDDVTNTLPLGLQNLSLRWPVDPHGVMGQEKPLQLVLLEEALARSEGQRDDERQEAVRMRMHLEHEASELATQLAQAKTALAEVAFDRMKEGKEHSEEERRMKADLSKEVAMLQDVHRRECEVRARESEMRERLEEEVLRLKLELVNARIDREQVQLDLTRQIKENCALRARMDELTDEESPL